MKLTSLALAISTFALTLNAIPAFAATTDKSLPAYGGELQGFDYGYPVQTYTFDSQNQSLNMRYIDVKPDHANGRTAVLLHGKNFCAGTWEQTIGVLSKAGYRVIAPDQIGFCKSTKPEHYQYTFQQLARNTHGLLESLGIHKATIIGHSTGGMLGIRYGLMYPNETEQLALVDPIGLENWLAKGVPPIGVDDWYKREQKTSADTIRKYETNTYYAGQWKPEYEKWVQMLAGMYRGPDKQKVAWNSALIYDMILNQPVVYELGDLKMPVLLMIGDKDNTAIAKEFAPADIRPTLGNYPELAKTTMAALKHGTLVEFPTLGHSPQIQDPDAFHAALLKGLAKVE
ncbi:alpha/beta hydrolase [Neorhizobium sp. NCHU2750]|uniref:alpha/beta fold hydrolase n=1 Tax=Neorhizobium sp. NCHU2750 TaxID=1825976 RepID=UPI000E7460D3|nr:alpha/beta hydrolase [Neorhizobium sp. NCHU2750]